jgi:hypothetical protein
MQKQMRVIETYKATYPNPIVVRAGEVLKVGLADPEQPDWFWCEGPDGRRGWVPKDCIEEGLAKCDYSAVELNAEEGDTLSVVEEKYGWVFGEQASGKRGWIPRDKVADL